MKGKDIQIHTFPNGVRLVHKTWAWSGVSHLGLVLDIGSRDEELGKEGLAHFWEHMAFKGTKARKAFHILNRIEAVGGELNAFTTKEKIWFQASALEAHTDRSVEILCDIAFDSVFPEKEMEVEKNVVLEEMSMYLDNPDESVHDDFEALYFKGHPLGFNILGTTKSVRGFKRSDLVHFVKSRMDTSRMCFAYVGPMAMSDLVALLQKPMEQLGVRKSTLLRAPFKYRPSGISRIAKDTTQAHAVLGWKAPDSRSSKRLQAFVLGNILGGAAMTSRLNMILREKNGLAYQVDAGYQGLTDAGLLTIYFGTEPKHLDKALSLIERELISLKEKKLGTLQLHRIQEQLIGQMVIAEEHPHHYLQMMGKSLLDYDRIETLASVVKKVRALSAIELMEAAEAIFVEKNKTGLIYIPSEAT
jgi:predicted Zn-dependent peptidase